MKVLSTKILIQSQRALLPEGITVHEESLIQIEFGQGLVIDQHIQHAVFTSGNAVKAVFEANSQQPEASSFDNVYCVGQKTKKLLEEKGVEVVEVANNALELAEVLAERLEQGTEVWFYCGNIRNNDLPEVLAENGILVAEAIVYTTKFVETELDVDYDVVLFYSPSGVKSFLNNKELQITNYELPKVICIGATTASEAIEHFEEVYIAEETSVESVIEKLKENIISI